MIDEKILLHAMSTVCHDLCDSISRVEKCKMQTLSAYLRSC